jgi:aspartate ammonia-lyase
VYKCRTASRSQSRHGDRSVCAQESIFRVVDTLGITGLHLARAENLADATQNADVFVEVSESAGAATTPENLDRPSSLSSGPQAGFAEIRLPPRQAGSSIMPGKVNPVIPEAVTQAAMLVMGYDSVIAIACASGNLELNPFLPLVALCLLDGIDLLANACEILRRNCVEGIMAEESRCRAFVEGSTAIVTALAPVIGYDGRAVSPKRTTTE